MPLKLSDRLFRNLSRFSAESVNFLSDLSQFIPVYPKYACLTLSLLSKSDALPSIVIVPDSIT